MSTTPANQQYREPTDAEDADAPRVNGWSFWEAFKVAHGLVDRSAGDVGCSTSELADYIAAKALTPNERLMLADFLRELPHKFPRGDRGKGRTPENRDQQREIARQVLEWQIAWCKENRRARVPKDLTTKKIEEKTAGTKHSVENIYNLLKNKARLA
jgi:hypothetical protein